MRILVVCAVREEAEAVEAGRTTRHELDILVCGVGPASAAAATSRTIAENSQMGRAYDVVVNAGICGAFKGRAEIGDTLIATDSVAADTTHALAEGAISLAEMKRLFDEGSVIILDARDASEYEQGHIPGAINIPYDRIPEYFDVLNSQVPTDAHVVVYCRSLTCDFSDQLATELKIIGYQNVSVFSGGWEQWTTAGYPIEGMVDK